MAVNGNSSAPNDRTQRAVERFLYRQSEVLDGRRWEEWLELFAPDGRYWMPVSEDQTAAEGVPNIFYEDRNLMKVRIKRVTHPRAHSQQPPNRTSHVVSNVVVERVEPQTGDVIAHSRFHAVEYRSDALRHFAGKYRHHLRPSANGYRILLQRVDLVNAEGPWDFVLQTWL